MKSLINEFEKLEISRENLLSGLTETDPLLDKKPFENKWSINQIVFHLIKTEHIILLSFKKNISQNDTSKTFLSPFKSLIIISTFRSPFKFTAPEIVRKVPDNYDFAQLVKKWKTIRGEMKEFLLKNNENFNSKNLFEHPYWGKLNIVQSIVFMREHFQRHLKQINKIRNGSYAK